MQFGLRLGFRNVNNSYVHGRKDRVHIGLNCTTTNSTFNTISGNIQDRMGE